MNVFSPSSQLRSSVPPPHVYTWRALPEVTGYPDKHLWPVTWVSVCSPAHLTTLEAPAGPELRLYLSRPSLGHGTHCIKINELICQCSAQSGGQIGTEIWLLGKGQCLKKEKKPTWCFNVLSINILRNQHEALRWTQRWSWPSLVCDSISNWVKMYWARAVLVHNADNSGPSHLPATRPLRTSSTPERRRSDQNINQKACQAVLACACRGSLHKARVTPNGFHSPLCGEDRELSSGGGNPSPAHLPSQFRRHSLPTRTKRKWQHLCRWISWLNSIKCNLLMCYDHWVCIN